MFFYILENNNLYFKTTYSIKKMIMKLIQTHIFQLCARKLIWH